MVRLAFIAALLCAATGAGEIFDRIAVTVGNQVITESQILTYLRVSAFMDHADVDLSPEKKRQAAERLVDQLLIQHDVAESHLNLQPKAAAEGLVAQTKEQYGSEQNYQAELRRYRIQESDVLAQFEAGLIGVTFSELRFRPGIQVTDDELRAYYNTVQDASSFEAAREEIEELIARQRETDALDRWLAETREMQRIQFHEQVFR